MSEERITDQLRELGAEIIPYLQSRLDLTKADATARIGKVVFLVTVLIIVGAILTLALLVASLGLAFWIGKALHEVYMGFFWVGLGYVVLALIIYLLRRPILYPLVINQVVQLIYQVDEEDEEPWEDQP